MPGERVRAGHGDRPERDLAAALARVAQVFLKLLPEPLPVEPARVSKLVDIEVGRGRVRKDVFASVRERRQRDSLGARLGFKPDHELTRERPRLRRDVVRSLVVDPYPGLLQHLARDRLL